VSKILNNFAEIKSMETPVTTTDEHQGPLHSNGAVVNGLLRTQATASEVQTGSETSTPASNRLKRKAKRLTKFLAKDLFGDQSIAGTRHTKNSRKPRNGQGRGLPKKGGAGGKGTWGAYGSELSSVVALDFKDPNYDSESLENGDITLESIIPEMPDEELHKHIEGTVLEFFEHGDVGEVIAILQDLPLANRKHKIVVVTIEAAMDHKPSHREMASRLISVLVEEMLAPEDMIKGFEKLLANLPETILDVPDAPTLLGNFLARCVADDCLLVASVHGFKDTVTNDYAKSALQVAEVMLADKVGILRLNNVWGVGGGAQPVKALSRRIFMLLQEFLSSNDAVEAGRCLCELEVPHFHHELVYEAIVMALESMQESTEEAICRLLKALSASNIVTHDQMKRGFFRVFEDLPDIVLDVPAAYTLVDGFVSRAQRHGFITAEIVNKVPVRGRKRFVSEGDGGKVKPELLLQ